MKRAMWILGLAGITYVVAWLLPVIDGGTTLARGGLPGWEAFQVTLSPIWDWDAWRSSDWFQTGIALLSGLTNGWFLYSAAALALRPERSRRVALGGLVLALLINAQWFLLADHPGDLRIGYYLWLTSFAILAVATLATAGRARVTPTPLVAPG